MNFTFDGDFQGIKNPYSINLGRGIYLFEVWGAQGGFLNSFVDSGRGGYASGIIKLKKSTKVYGYIGEK